MAKRRRSTRRRRRGTGSVIRIRRVNGLGQLNNPSSTVGASMPVLIGGGITALTTIGISQWMQPTPDNEPFMRNAPWIGVGAGVLAALGLGAMTKKRPTTVMAVTSAIAVGLAFLLPGWMSSMSSPLASNGANANGATAGLRAVVPEYSMRGLGNRGTGAIVMEPHASRGYGAGALGRGRGRGGVGAYGDVVNLGAINPKAFGTPGFQLSGR